MKSIMEEASSVVKAIEKAWVQAGKPQEFTIKVFEEATKNFIGMTIRPAKIAIFFQEKNAPLTQQSARQKFTKSFDEPKTKNAGRNDGSLHGKNKRQDAYSEKSMQSDAAPIKKQTVPTTKPSQHKNSQSAPVSNEPKVKQEVKETWTPEMVTAAQDWMQGLLGSLDKQQFSFSTEVKNYYLRITIATPVFADAEQEKTLFRNSAYLIMQSLRNKFKKSFRGFKVIVSSTR